MIAKHVILSQDNFGNGIAAVEAARKKHESIQTDIRSYETRVQGTSYSNYFPLFLLTFFQFPRAVEATFDLEILQSYNSSFHTLMIP